MIDVGQTMGVKLSKTCTKCSVSYTATTEFFPPHKLTTDGLQSWCRECSRVCSRAYEKTDKRVISKFDEKVYRCCHHNFQGLSQADAAKKLNVSQSTISRALLRVKAKAPQLFPLLSPQQNLVHTHITGFGATHEQVAQFLGVSLGAVEKTVAQLRSKGVCLNVPSATVRYASYLDHEVKQKF